MSDAAGSTLFVFIDESGNFDFSPNGTRYWALTAVATEDPMRDRGSLLRLRYELLAEGHDQERFHATEDPQDVRNRIYATVADLADIHVHTAFIQKNKTSPTAYQTQTRGGKKKGQEHNLYGLVAQSLHERIFKRYGKQKNLQRVVVVLGSLFTRTKQDVINQTLKEALKTYIGKPFHIYFHDGRADINSQIADYCSWAIYRSLEDGEMRPLLSIKSKIKTKVDIFENVEDTHYGYPEG